MKHSGVLTMLGAIQDRISRFSFLLAAACLAAMAIAYSYEIFSRYVFGAPTIWASPVVSYVLCIMIFLSLPELTRQSSHINIDWLEARLSPESLLKLRRVTRAIAGISCLFAVWFSMVETVSEFEMGILTNTYLAIPKWWLSVTIPYGFFGAALHFFRQACGDDTLEEVSE